MSPTPRWHAVNCTVPDVVVFDGCLLWCKKCESLFSPQDIESCSASRVQEPDTPNLQKQEMSLSWPSSIYYHPKGDTCDAPSDKADQAQTKPLVTEYTTITTIETNSYTKSYDYGTLTSDDEVRILELSRGKSEDLLHGTLTRQKLGNFAGYEALSYTWTDYDGDEPAGDNVKGDLIHLGRFWDAFPITRNCYNALRRLRYPQKTRILWIDSICINQDNRYERSHQVQLMKRIYENALVVVVYLGTGDEQSSLALQLLRKPDCLPRAQGSELAAIAALFRKPYFSRLWIVQEIALAKSLHFYCGSSEAFLPIFAEMTLESLVKLRRHVPAWLKYSALRHVTAPRTLLSLLEDTLSCQCSDPRDKVFGLLGLTEDDLKNQLKPDYTLSVEDIYTGVAAFLIEEEGLLPVLNFASRMPTLERLPSWVPNWAACSTHPFHVTPGSFLDKPLKDIFPGEVRNLEITNLGYKGRKENSIPDVSINGIVAVKGILFCRSRAYNYDIEHHQPLLLQNSKVSVGFSYTGAMNNAEKVKLVSDQLCILLLSPLYSDALLLTKIIDREEFSLINVIQPVAIIQATKMIVLPKALCMESLSNQELSFMRTAAILQSGKVPLAEEIKLPWKIRREVANTQEVEEFIQSLTSLRFCDFFAYCKSEMTMWAGWQDLEGKCLPIIEDAMRMGSIADYIKASNDNDLWKAFPEKINIASGLHPCLAANILNLYLHTPFQKHTVGQDTASVDESRKMVEDPQDLLAQLLQWGVHTSDLLQHMEEACIFQKHLQFIKDIPGGELLKSARTSWGYHSHTSQALRYLCKVENDVLRSYPWLMKWKAGDQALNTFCFEGEDPISDLPNPPIWSWGLMRSVMEARMVILAELMNLLRLFEDELGSCNLDLLLSKLGTRRIMKDLGYDLDDDAVRNQKVMIA